MQGGWVSLIHVYFAYLQNPPQVPSKKTSYEQTEDALSTRLAYDTSLLAASSFPRTLCTLRTYGWNPMMQRSWSFSGALAGALPSPSPGHHSELVAGASAPAELLPSRGPCAVGLPPCSPILAGRDGVRCTGRALAVA